MSPIRLYISHRNPRTLLQYELVLNQFVPGYIICVPITSYQSNARMYHDSRDLAAREIPPWLLHVFRGGQKWTKKTNDDATVVRLLVLGFQLIVDLNDGHELIDHDYVVLCAAHWISRAFQLACRARLNALVKAEKLKFAMNARIAELYELTSHALLRQHIKETGHQAETPLLMQRHVSRTAQLQETTSFAIDAVNAFEASLPQEEVEREKIKSGCRVS